MITRVLTDQITSPFSSVEKIFMLLTRIDDSFQLESRELPPVDAG